MPYKFYENSTKLLCNFRIKFHRMKSRTMYRIQSSIYVGLSLEAMNRKQTDAEDVICNSPSLVSAMRRLSESKNNADITTFPRLQLQYYLKTSGILTISPSFARSLRGYCQYSPLFFGNILPYAS